MVFFRNLSSSTIEGNIFKSKDINKAISELRVPFPAFNISDEKKEDSETNPLLKSVLSLGKALVKHPDIDRIYYPLKTRFLPKPQYPHIDYIALSFKVLEEAVKAFELLSEECIKELFQRLPHSIVAK